MSTKTLRILCAAALAATLASRGASAQPTTLFSDDFGPKPLAGWQASPLGLLSNWDASSGAAAYDGGGHTQLVAGSASWAMLPASSSAGSLASLTLNGSSVAFTTETVKGIAYAVFPAASGNYVATYAP